MTIKELQNLVQRDPDAGVAFLRQLSTPLWSERDGGVAA